VKNILIGRRNDRQVFQARYPGARSGYFSIAAGGIGAGSDDGGSIIKKILMTMGGILLSGTLIFLVFVSIGNAPDTSAVSGNKNNDAGRDAAVYDSGVRMGKLDAELPPGMLDPNSEWGSYFVNKGTEETDSPISDSSWNAFVAAAVKAYRRPDGKPSIIEKVLPEDVSSSMSMNVFTLYSYIREVNPGVEANIALVEACSMLYYADKTNLPLSLVVGVSQTESNFRPSAVSSAKARGIMQVMWKYHWAVLQANGIREEKHLHDPELGIVAGTIVLSRYLKQEQSIPGALARYYGVLSNKYMGMTLSHKHAYELYSSGISESWKNSMARERHYWNRMTGGGEALSAKSAPKIPGSNGKIGSSVVVQASPSIKTGSSAVSKTSVKAPSSVQKKNLPTTVGSSAGSLSQTGLKNRNMITVVYRNGKKVTWQDDGLPQQ